MELSRRGLCQTLPLLFGSLAFGATDDKPISSFATPFDQLPVHTGATSTARSILNGQTHAGCHLEVHETTLAPGQMPHPPHQHEHEELFLIMRGQLEVTIAGNTTTIGPGSAAFVHSGELHSAKNTGPQPAQYFVVAVGKEA
jgi:quercetin dioxygenase-like cupin family protein